MADSTEIAWCDSTFNPWIGCTKVGPGCDHCYAEADFDLRKHRAKWGPGNPRSRTSAHNWRQPLRWNSKRFMECGACGWRGECEAELIGCGNCGSISHMDDARRRVFCASLADVFDNEVPEQWRGDLFALIDQTPDLDWLILTKRIGNAERMMVEATRELRARDPGRAILDNVWLGATVVNQAEADRDIPKLLAIPAAVRWLSMEPLLGAVDLLRARSKMMQAAGPAAMEASRESGWIGVDWVVVGGESGPKARPMSPDWVRGLRDQCAAAGVPFLFKQWGEWAPNWLNDDAGQKIAGSEWMDRMGKKSAGRLLDGKPHHEFPSRPVVIGVDPAAQGADRTVYQIPAFLRRQS